MENYPVSDGDRQEIYEGRALQTRERIDLECTRKIGAKKLEKVKDAARRRSPTTRPHMTHAIYLKRFQLTRITN